MSNLLLEIGTEEIPAGYIVPALKQMEELFAEQVKKARLSIDSIHKPVRRGVWFYLSAGYHKIRRTLYRR